MSSKSPYISFVVTSRNDNHGGDLTKRMSVFTRGLIDQCDKHHLLAELIFVDWNPPVSEAPLSKLLPRPEPSSFLTIRHITVPPEIHNEHNFSERLYLFQMIAKNVGIRRAKAPFVLCTNIDLLFSNELIAFLSKRQLSKGKYYRANRCDIPNDFNPDQPTSKLIKWAEQNIIKVNGKSSFYPNFTDTTSTLFKYWGMIPIFRLLSWVKKIISSPLRDKLNCMDTDACGDFTLMHKDDWERILGYPELEVYSLHIDSMGLYAAVAMGIEQVILPWNHRAFHISHENGWEFKNEKDKVMFYTNKPVLDWWAVHQWGVKIIKEGRTFDINGPSWGLANETLEETVVP
ncbi:MAG: hypothetical protein Salg2KO_03760 [Salibacteraceae bacterium]